LKGYNLVAVSVLLDREIASKDGEIGPIQIVMEGKRLELSKLQESKKDPLVAMGPNVPRLVQILKDQEWRFLSPPVGPLALFVKVKEDYSEFRPAIECALKNSLKSFVVANHKDLELFQELRTKVGCFPHEGKVGRRLCFAVASAASGKQSAER
jgi:chromosome segregation ATPase